MEYTGVDVVIPAHDEQDLLAGCLDALEDCIAATPVPVTVTVVLDSCRDATEEIARERARIVRTSARNVGIWTRGGGLAGAVNAMQLFGSTRIMMRTGLHYPQSYPTALKAAQCGMRVGQESGPIFMARYEDVFHLPIPQAREALGIRDHWLENVAAKIS